MKKRKQENPIEEVSDYMTAPVITIPETKTIKDAAEYMHDQQVGSLVVLQGKKPVGIVTETDFARKVVAKGLNPNTAKVADIMTTPLQTIDCHESVLDANKLMAKKKIRHLVVMDKEELVGIVSVHNLVHYFSNPRIRTF
ncbi:CBS domain-containing protein [Nitrospina gracilis]|uniref:CBS domain-containing protein n=1 Tax=Nitrospina gracilis TaxID=35801 RepID=UPI001F18F113|nr:CBS domain-containing protein [Nitrospina gracilis]MCF8720380.1 signal-transduction protein with cAMP-binding, CBS, and nucleotidyltransferase domain [Nitrospina gracilis Nb-211]